MSAGACIAIAAIGAPGLVASAGSGADRQPHATGGKVKDGTWRGTAVDDKYGSVGAIRFQVRNDGRLVRNLRVSDVAGDCPGPSGPVLGIRIKRAKIRSSGLMRGHFVEGDPGNTILNVVSYDARLGRTSVSNGRIYQNNDINNVGANQCEVPSVTFTAVGGSG
jgi:hypothetical protein